MTTPTVDLLVLAAHEPDLRGMRSVLGDKLHATVRGLTVVAKTVGLGVAVAGGGAARRVVTLSPRAAVFVGTCGVYPERTQYRPQDVLVPEKISLLCPEVLAGRAQFPEPMQTEVGSDPILMAGLSTCGHRNFVGNVGSPLGLTTDDTLAARIGSGTGLHAENLEVFSVAQACAAGHVPFAAVVGVTHVTGARGAEDQVRYRAGAAMAACGVVSTWLGRGAQGLPHQ